MADEKVKNDLLVQGRIIRDNTEGNLDYLYKGEKLSQEEIDTKKPYAVNDVVGEEEFNNIKFSKYTPDGFIPDTNFSTDIIDKRFEVESIYYNNLNNGFNVCRNSFLNIINALNPYSSTNDTLFKDSDYQLVSDNIQNSLENFIKYYFYTKESLTKLVVKSREEYNIKLSFIYNYNLSKYSFSQKETYLNFKINSNIEKNLSFNNDGTTTTLKHIDRTNYNIGNENKSGWNASGTFSIYDTDEHGHITNKSNINLTFPKRPRLVKRVLYSGERNNGEFSENDFNYSSSELKDYIVIEFIFKMDPCGLLGYNTPLYKSVYVDPSYIQFATNATKFRGIKFQTTRSYNSRGYGGGTYSYSNKLITENFEDSLLFPTGSGGGEVLSYTYNKIVKIIGYYTSIY